MDKYKLAYLKNFLDNNKIKVKFIIAFKYKKYVPMHNIYKTSVIYF